MFRASILVALTVCPLQAHGLCLTKSYLRDWSEQVSDRINYLLCLHDEQQSDLAKLSNDLIRTRADLMMAQEKIGQLESQIIDLESQIEQ